MALVVLGLIGAVLGFLLGIADKYLQVKVDERIVNLNEMLPKFNCGACGYAGCNGFAEGIINGEISSLKQCKPMKPAVREEIKKYLEDTPAPDGTVIKIEA